MHNTFPCCVEILTISGSGVLATMASVAMVAVGAVFGLLVGIATTHELLVGYRLPLYSSRVPSWWMAWISTQHGNVLCIGVMLSSTDLRSMDP